MTRNLKAQAIQAFEDACKATGPVDWESLSRTLAAALMPTPRKSKDDTPLWWHCYEPNKKAERSIIEVVFEDGETIRANVRTTSGKPYNLGLGVRVAIAFYRSRVARRMGDPEVVRIVKSLPYEERLTTHEHRDAGTAHIAVPPIVAIHRVDTGESFDASEVSRLTEAWRSGPWTYADALDRAEAAPQPDGPCIYEPMEARQRWIKYQVQLDYSRTWIRHCEDARRFGWFASLEDAREAESAREAVNVVPMRRRPALPALAARLSSSLAPAVVVAFAR